MRRDPRCPLADVDRAAADITRFVRGLDSSAYVGNTPIRAAVGRKFEIVGEALNRLRNDHPEVAERIPRLRRIADFRNFPIHAYDSVEPDRIWTHARHDLPEVRRTVQALLSELGPLKD